MPPFLVPFCVFARSIYRASRIIYSQAISDSPYEAIFNFPRKYVKKWSLRRETWKNVRLWHTWMYHSLSLIALHDTRRTCLFEHILFLVQECIASKFRSYDWMTHPVRDSSDDNNSLTLINNQENMKSNGKEKKIYIERIVKNSRAVYSSHVCTYVCKSYLWIWTELKSRMKHFNKRISE